MLFINLYPEEILNSDINLISGPAPSTNLSAVKLLIWLCRKVKGNIVEIGTHAGYTTAFLSKYNPDKYIYTIDYLDPSVMCKEQSGESPGEGWGKRCRDLKNVLMIQRNSRTLDYGMFVNPALVFIDGDHSYEGVKEDTELALEGLRNSKSEPPKIIVWHDWILSVNEKVPWYLVGEYVNKEIAPKMDVIAFELGTAYTILT